MRLLGLIKDFFRDLVSGRRLLLSLAKNDFKARYAGSFFGILWAFVMPLVTIAVFWFVFQIGFNSAPIDNYPYILWLIPSYLSWSYFSEALMASTNTFYDFAFLVKKIKFNTGILPNVKILSGLFVHLFFIGFIFVMYGLYGFTPSIYNLQVFYYLFCGIVLVMALSYLASSLAVFFRDMGNIVGVIMQVLFWATPIVWNPGTFAPSVIQVLKFNPMYYICIGYRDAFMQTDWFFNKPILTLYFWLFTIIVFLLGIIIYQRTKRHFADVL